MDVDKIFSEFLPSCRNGNGTTAAIVLLAAAVHDHANVGREQSNLAVLADQLIGGILAWRSGAEYDFDFDEMLRTVGALKE